MPLFSQQSVRDDDGDGLRSDLERLAQLLDRQCYPGQAWPVAQPQTASFSRRKVLAAALALAATGLLAIGLVREARQAALARRPAEATSTAGSLAHPLDDASLPQMLVVVEDLESYSLIDLTTTTPMISFAVRDAAVPPCVVPLLPEPLVGRDL